MQSPEGGRLGTHAMCGCGQNMKREKNPTDECAKILLVLIILREEREKEQVEGRGGLNKWCEIISKKQQWLLKIISL